MRTTSSWLPRSTAYSLARPLRERAHWRHPGGRRERPGLVRGVVEGGKSKGSLDGPPATVVKLKTLLAPMSRLFELNHNQFTINANARKNISRKSKPDAS